MLSATVPNAAHEAPNPAAPTSISSTGPAPSPPDTSRAPAAFGPGDSQSKMAPSSVKMGQPGGGGRITVRWTEPTLIGVKPVPSSSATSKAAPGPKPVGTAGMVGRRALPGLANPAAVMVVDKDERAASKDEDRDRDKGKEQRTGVPPSSRHVRIPSTGNRALVMDVAQALSEAAHHQHQHQREGNSKKGAKEVREGKENTTTPAPTGPPVGGAAGETRKSSYERYSAVAMPSLTEERTPASTMSRNVLLGVKVASESPMSSLRAESAGGAEQPPPSPSSKVYIGVHLSL